MDTISSVSSKLWDVFNIYSVEVRSKFLGSEYDYSLYYSALDSIQDMEGALYEFSNLKRKPTLLECLGFLQSLFIQQDAVLILSKIFNLDWDFGSEVELQYIRNIRNRVVGHPNEARHKKPISTSFFPSNNITKKEFEATIQFEDNWETVNVNFKEYVSKNDIALTRQLLKVLNKAQELEKKMFNQQPYKTSVDG